MRKEHRPLSSRHSAGPADIRPDIPSNSTKPTRLRRIPLIVMKIRPVLQALADLFFPRECTVCGRRLIRSERYLCMDCELDLPRTYFWQTERNVMADKFNALVQKRLDRELTIRERDVRPVGKGGPTHGKSHGHEPYARAAALFFYDSRAGYRRIPQALKYDGAIGIGRHYARRFASRLNVSPLYQDVTLVVPVPLHPLRQWKRGYNQAAVIAREIAVALNAPLDENMLYRRRRTRTQTQLTIGQKAANVDGAFAVRRNRLPLPGKTDSRHPTAVHVLLVDDVFTTGATLEACHAALRAAWQELGIAPHRTRISIATLAFVGKP